MKRNAAVPIRGRLDRRLRALRLYSGLVLFAFVCLHFFNHMLALVSLDAAEAFRPWFLLIWRNPVGTILLYAALLTHIGLALFALYRRRTLVMPPREACQVVLGLLIPVLIVEHVIGTRLNNALTGVPDTYRYVLNSLWVLAPMAGARQVFAIFAVWIHACLGLYFWQRQKPWFERAGGPLLVGAALVPVLTALAFVVAGRAVAEIGFVPDPADHQRMAAASAIRERVGFAIYASYAAALLAVLLLRFARAFGERRLLDESERRRGAGAMQSVGHWGLAGHRPRQYITPDHDTINPRAAHLLKYRVESRLIRVDVVKGGNSHHSLQLKAPILTTRANNAAPYV